MRQQVRAGLVAMGTAVVLAVAGIAGAQAPASSTTTEKIDFTVISVEGNKLVARDSHGATKEYTVPADFRFDVGGNPVAVSQLKPGMKGTATITTTTTVTPVTVTEVRDGTVMQASGNSLLVRTADGIRMFSVGELARRNVTIMRDGQPISLANLRTGDRLTATIVTEQPPQVMTARQVEATMAGAAATTGTGAAAAAGAATAAARSTAGAASAGADAAAPRRLPKTASNAPLLALSGGLVLAFGAMLTAIRRYGEVR